MRPSNFRAAENQTAFYGLLAANPFGQHDFEKKKDQPHLGDYTLKKGTALTQRYQLVIHQGTIDTAKVEDAWKAFGRCLYRPCPVKACCRSPDCPK